MKKEEILNYFSDINVAYNDCMKKHDLEKMLEELIESVENKYVHTETNRADNLLMDMNITMTNIQNACVLLIRELYKTEPTGGDLHIVTDDFNVSNSDLYWCEDNIGKYIDEDNKEFVKKLETSIVSVLELLTIEERFEVVREA